jgi:FkbM family methyltransferase
MGHPPNVGLFTLAAASRVGSAGRVTSFEPAALTRAALARNVELNQMTCVSIRGEALGAADCAREFFSFTGDGAGLSSFSPAQAGGSREWVPVTTLDRALGGEPGPGAALVKLDLEGAEYDALRGADWLLREVRPRLVLEVDESHLRRQGRSAREVMSLLDEADYRVRAIVHDDSAIGYRLKEEFEIGRATVNVLATPNEKVAQDRASSEQVAPGGSEWPSHGWPFHNVRMLPQATMRRSASKQHTRLAGDSCRRSGWIGWIRG